MNLPAMFKYNNGNADEFAYFNIADIRRVYTYITGAGGLGMTVELYEGERIGLFAKDAERLLVILERACKLTELEDDVERFVRVIHKMA